MAETTIEPRSLFRKSMIFFISEVSAFLVGEVHAMVLKGCTMFPPRAARTTALHNPYTLAILTVCFAAAVCMLAVAYSRARVRATEPFAEASAESTVAAWRQTPEARMDGEARLRAALQAVRPERSASQDSASYDVWAELFEQENGGQLFVQGEGAQVHSASDVVVNTENAFSQYLLHYNDWVAKLRAMAFPTVLRFEDGIRGVFCDSYQQSAPDGKDTMVYSVCDNVGAPENIIQLRSFWQMLETIALMRLIHERERLTGVSAKVSDEIRAAADRYAQEVEMVASESASRIRSVVQSMDARMKQRTKKHSEKMRQLRAMKSDYERKVSSRQAEIQAINRDIKALQSSLSSSSNALEDSGAALERLRLKLSAEQKYLEADIAKLKNMRGSLDHTERVWADEQKKAAQARRNAILARDEAAARENEMSSRIKFAQEDARSAEKAAKENASSGNSNAAHAKALASDAAKAQQHVRALEIERDRLVAANNATAARIQLASEQLGQVQAEADAASVDVVQKAAKIRRTDSQRQASKRDLVRAKAEAKIRTGKSTISSASVDKLEKTLHKKRESILDRQQALLQAQYQVLDSGKSLEAPKPEQGPANGVLHQGAVMRANVPGRDSMSKDGVKLAMQSDGNLVLYGPGGPLWQTNTRGQGFSVVMQKDGNLVVRDSSNTQKWASKPSNKGAPPYKAVVQSDGNFVVYDSANKASWATGTRLPPPEPAAKKWVTYMHRDPIEQNALGKEECYSKNDSHDKARGKCYDLCVRTPGCAGLRIRHNGCSKWRHRCQLFKQGGPGIGGRDTREIIMRLE